jgi:hypothetical protein
MVKEVLKKVIGVFAFTSICALFLGLYLLGFLHGYTTAKLNLEIQISGLLNSIVNLERPLQSPSPTPSLSPTPVKKTVVTTPTIKKDSGWGGPELWTAVNNKRATYGVNKLNQRDELCTIASIRLNELLVLGKLDNHEGFSNMTTQRPDLKWIFDKYGTIAEFLALGGRSADETVSMWDNTLGHKKLLTGGEYVWGCIYAQNTFAVAIAAY